MEDPGITDEDKALPVTGHSVRPTVTSDDPDWRIKNTLFPPGPALLFVRPGDRIGAVSAVQVDQGLPKEGGLVSVEINRRDLRLLRALCEHVLELIDREGV